MTPRRGASGRDGGARRRSIAPWTWSRRSRRGGGSRAGRPPLVVLDRIAAFLDAQGLGSGPVHATRIGEGGGSNFTFLLEREEGRFVLRRPPRPPLPPSAHDMVREARFQLALREAGFGRLP